MILYEITTKWKWSIGLYQRYPSERSPGIRTGYGGKKMRKIEMSLRFLEKVSGGEIRDARVKKGEEKVE